MPVGMGENVGRAYVSIYADGSSIPDDIRDELEKADGSVRAKGDEHGAAYDAAMAKRIKNGTIAKELRGALGRGIADGMKVDEFFRSNQWTHIEKYIQKRWGEVGLLASKEMADKFRVAGSLDGFERQFERFNERVATLMVRAHGEALAENARFDAAELRRQNAANRERLAAMRKLESESRALFRETDNLSRKAAQDMVNDWKKVGGVWVDLSGRLRDFRTTVLRHGVEMDRFIKKNHEAVGSLDHFAHGLGKAFGRGSRNDFLHFFGGLMAVVPHTMSAVGKLTSKFLELGAEIGESTKGLSGMAKAMGVMQVLGPLLAKGAAGGLALGASLTIASTLISQVAGAATALVGTLGLGLVGAASAAAGSLVPLVGGLGVAVIAFTSFDDAQKKVIETASGPLKDAFAGLADIAADNVFAGLADNLARLTPVVQSLAPAMDAVSQAVGRQIGAWASLASSGGLTSFITLIRTDMPRQIDALGASLRGMTTGLTGLFEGLSPTVTRFTENLAGLMDRFSAWSNSAEGQNSIRRFFTEAYDAALALKDAGGAAITVVSSLFRAGAKFGGNELFGDMADQFREWNTYLTDPANQAAIQQWVADGAEFARAIGDMGTAVGEFIADLDTPVVREGISTSFRVIADSIRMVGDAARLSTEGIRGLFGVMDAVGVGFDTLKMGLSPLPGLFNALGGSAEEVKKETGSTTGFFNNLAGAARGMAGSMGNAATKAAGLVAPLVEQQKALAESREAARKSAAGWFDMGAAIDKAKGSMDAWIRQMNSQAKALEAFTENTRRAARKGLDEGVIKSLEALGPAGAAIMRKLANDTGNGINRANAAFARGEAAIQSYANMRVPPKELTVDNSQAMDAITAMEYALSQIKDKSVTVTTNLVYKRAGIDVATGGDASGAYYGKIGSTPQLRWTYEDGPEAVVPLNRPLGQVDPSVRALSAIAQGKAVVGGTGKSVDASGWTIVSASEDAEAVALATLNHLTAQTY